MSDAAAAPKPAGRPMKHPYTFSAKLAQFPYKFYFKNNWLVKYYCLSLVLCAPVFWKIQKLSCSEPNVRTWEEKKRLEAASHH